MSDLFKDNVLKNKTVFVAGGSSGINLGIGEAMAKAGANIAILARKQERIDTAVEGLKALGAKATGYSADVRDYEAVEAAFQSCADEFGEIDCVISGAAGNFLAPVNKMSANAFKTVVDIDLIGTFNVFRASWDVIRKNGTSNPSTSLIAITAGQAVSPMPLQAHVGAAKAGINTLIKCLAFEWGPAGVRVNGISPGPIAGTEGMDRLAASPKIEAAMKSKLPLRAFGSKQDVADLAIYLASSASNYVTGAIYNVDGGHDTGDASADCLSGETFG